MQFERLISGNATFYSRDREDIIAVKNLAHGIVKIGQSCVCWCALDGIPVFTYFAATPHFL